MKLACKPNTSVLKYVTVICFFFTVLFLMMYLGYKIEYTLQGNSSEAVIIVQSILFWSYNSANVFNIYYLYV